MTPEQRQQWLPVMEVLVKVMETSNPRPEDINTLLVLSRDLSQYAPEGFNAFAGFEGIKEMGLPESGDVIRNVQGTPHIMTSFGEFFETMISFKIAIFQIDQDLHKLVQIGLIKLLKSCQDYSKLLKLF